MHREVEDVQLVLVQLVDHEADDLLALLGHHADAVALAQAAQEILLRPGVFKTLLLRLQHFRHVPTDHPPDMHANLFLLRSVRAHSLAPLPSEGARPPPWAPHAPALPRFLFRLNRADGLDRSGGMPSKRRFGRNRDLQRRRSVATTPAPLKTITPRTDGDAAQARAPPTCSNSSPTKDLPGPPQKGREAGESIPPSTALLAAIPTSGRFGATGKRAITYRLHGPLANVFRKFINRPPRSPSGRG